MRQTLRVLLPFRHRAFALLFAGQTASSIGDGLYAVALPWFVLSHRGGPLVLAAVVASYGVSRTVLMPLGGAVADRFSPWRSMLAADVVRMVAVAVFAGVAAGGVTRLVVLVPVALALGAGAGVFIPGSGAIVPSLVPASDLQASNSLSMSGNQLAGLLGPAVGGAVVGAVGPDAAFAADALTFGISAVTLAVIPRVLEPASASAASVPTKTSHASGSQTVRHEANDAEEHVSLIALLRTSGVLRIVVLIVIAANLSVGGVIEVALPALVRGPLAAGAGGYGVILAVFSVGGLLGTLSAGLLKQPPRPAYVLSAANGAGMAALAVIPYLGGFTGAAAACAVTGFLMMFGNLIAITAFQRWAPPRLLGRVMGLLMLASMGVFPISVMLGGLIVRSLGAAAAFPIAGGVSGTVLILSLTSRSWRQFSVPDPGERVAALEPRDATAAQIHSD